MDQHPKTARNIADSIRGSEARCAHVSSFWAYLPLQRSTLNEEHPRTGGNAWVQLRRQAEDILQEAGAAVLNMPDFYGPEVHTSVLQQPLVDASQGKPMNWIGSAETEREHVYVPDAMTLAARIAKYELAYGKRWIVPGSGPLSGRRAAEIAGKCLGREVKARAAGLTMLRIVGLFNKPLRAFLKMVPEYLKPIAFDGSKLRGLLGDVENTSYEKGFQETLGRLSQR